MLVVRLVASLVARLVLLYYLLYFFFVKAYQGKVEGFSLNSKPGITRNS